eukprot:Hpha_TRINITY_DN15327_c5_g1::TRINITY_DN15327_c5_g1_i1::g.91081::m.91081
MKETTPCHTPSFFGVVGGGSSQGPPPHPQKTTPNSPYGPPPFSFFFCFFFGARFVGANTGGGRQLEVFNFTNFNRQLKIHFTIGLRRPMAFVCVLSPAFFFLFVFFLS